MAAWRLCVGLVAAALLAPRAEAQYDFRAPPLAHPPSPAAPPRPHHWRPVANGAPDDSLHLGS